MANNNIKELSIQVSLNGLSFCILNRSTNTIVYLHRIEFEKKLSPFDILNRLKSELSSNTSFSEAFDDVIVIHQNELATLVPAELFDETYKADYLKFNSKILKTDYITSDDIAVNNSVNVYVPYMNINNYIFDTFGEFVFKHASSILIDAVLQQQGQRSEPVVFIHVNRSHVELLVLENDKLQLYNHFEFRSKEDLIYYVLFVYEQLELNVETTPIKVSGQIDKNDDNYAILYTYIRHVELVEISGSFKLNEDLDIPEIHHHYLILNSFS